MTHHPLNLPLMMTRCHVCGRWFKTWAQYPGDTMDRLRFIGSQVVKHHQAVTHDGRTVPTWFERVLIRVRGRA